MKRKEVVVVESDEKSVSAVDAESNDGEKNGLLVKTSVQVQSTNTLTRI